MPSSEKVASLTQNRSDLDLNPFDLLVSECFDEVVEELKNET